MSGSLAAIFVRRSGSPILTWTKNTIPASGAGYSVHHGNGLWRMEGNSSSQFYAVDPTLTWTLNNPYPGTTVYTSFYGSDGYWVIGGSPIAGNTWIYTGTTGTGSWTLRTQINSAFAGKTVRKLYHNGTYWVAVGNAGKMATATDPTGTWTAATSSFGITDIRSISYDGTYWVAVGLSGKLATATDPTGLWTQRTSSFGTAGINGVHYANGKWVAVGFGNKIATATDPTGTWTQVSAPPFGTSNVNGIYYGNGIWVAVGEMGKIASTLNPSGTWQLNVSPMGTVNLWDVYYGSDGYWTLSSAGGDVATAAG